MDLRQCELIGESLVRKFQTRDPFVIADGLGIKIYDDCDLGNLKGFYKVIKRNRCIFINKNLNEHEAAMVCGHEIGHDQAHRDVLKSMEYFPEFTLYNMASRQEYEANIILSAITLDDNEIIQYIKYYNYDAEQIARAMNSDINLIALKISHLIEAKGLRLRGIEHNSRFLNRSFNVKLNK